MNKYWKRGLMIAATYIGTLFIMWIVGTLSAWNIDPGAWNPDGRSVGALMWAMICALLTIPICLEVK